MKKKVLLGFGACALALGGVAALVSGRQVVETKADGVGYYLVGDGSFSTEAWTNAGGLQLQSNAGNNGALLCQHLAEDDVFKIVNTARDYWYGFESYQSGGSYFGRTSYTRSDKSRAEMSFSTSNCTWWANEGSKTVVNAWGGAEGHGYSANTQTNAGTVEIYTDNTTVKFERSASNTNYAQLSLPTDWSAKNTFVLNSDGNGGDWQWWDEKGTNVVVKETGYYNIFLNVSCKIYISDAIQDWINGYMHMSDDDYAGDGTGLCKSAGTYSAAKSALIALGTGAVEYFRVNTGSKYTDALARYTNWALANEDATPFAGGGTVNVVLSESQNQASNGIVIATVAVGVAAFAGIGAMYVARKHREND